MAAISEPSREAFLWTFSVNRADGHFLFCLFDFPQTVRECCTEKKSACFVSSVKKKSERTTWQHLLTYWNRHLSVFCFLTGALSNR